MLGLGLGINKSNRVPTALELLLKYTSVMWHVPKATGTSEGINSPFTNPLIDLKGVVGKNLFDPVSIASIPPNSFRQGNGYRSYSNSSFVNGVVVNLTLKPNTTYSYRYDFILGGNATGNGTFFTVDGNLSFDVGTASPKTRTFTTGVGGLVTFNFMRSGGGNDLLGWIDVSNIQLELGSVATAYEPYGKANLLLQGFAGTTSSGYAPVVCKNIGQEGSYSNLIQPFTAFNGTVSLSGNTVISTGNGTNSVVEARSVLALPLNTKRYFLEGRARVTNSLSTRLRIRDTSGILVGVDITNPVQNQWYTASAIATVSSGDIRCFHDYADATTANGKSAEFDVIQVINLTDNPLVQSLESQLGRQLTVAECDYLFTFTASTATVKAKTVPFLKYDSTNDYGIGSNPSLEILSTSDFGFGRVLSLPTLTTQYFKMKSDTSEATTQYGLKLLNTGVLQIILQGTAIQIATGILPNTMYSIWVERISGVLKCFINSAEVSSVANTTSLTSRTNYRDGAMTTAIDGSTLTGYTNQFLGADTIAKENVLQARSAWFAFTLKTFGV